MNRYLVKICSIACISGVRRARYFRRKRIFGSIGEHVMIQPWNIPYNPQKCFIGDNVRIAAGVHLVTHDVTHHMLNNIPELREKGYQFKEKTGEIHIGNNVFVGANCIILYDVNIGNNVIIGAGSIVTHNIPDNSVVAGVPAKVIGSFDRYIEKRLSDR